MRDRFLRACWKQPVDRTPIWIMRQAGRYLPEYRKIRERHSMLEAIRTPELAVEITLQPLRRFDLDAAIVFGDILPPLESVGIGIEFARGEGPVIANPVRSSNDVQRLRTPDAGEIAPYTVEAVSIVSRELADRVPLIGFAGAPFTLASYLVEGGSSRDHARTKRLMYAEPDTWHSLMAKLARMVGLYLRDQVTAGARAVQLFDSWVGALGPDDYREFVLPHSRETIRMAREAGVPVIHFSTGTGGMLELIGEAGGDVIGIDWRVDIGEAWSRIGDKAAIQGNLDPLALLGPVTRMRQRAEAVLQQAGGRAGHIFNLGHGVLPDTPVEHVNDLVEFVHARAYETA